MLNYNVDRDLDTQHNAFRERVNFEKHYEIVKHLGDGKFGKVYHVRDRENNREYAAKFIKIKKDTDKLDVEREVSILKNLAHAKIVELHDAFSTLSNNVVLIMEIVKGGELFDRIADENFIVSEPDAMRIIKQLCEALHYIHRKNIIHLDIKPENIMLLSQNRNEIKLIDFGLARFFNGKEDIKFMAGTPEFAAPEVIKFENLDFHTDMWSVGVITYILLSGYSPFLGENNAETYCNVEKGEWAFTEEFDIISSDAKDFISKLIVYNKQSRMLPQECLDHPWLAKEMVIPTQTKKKQFNTVLPIITKENTNDHSKSNPVITNPLKNVEQVINKQDVIKKVLETPTVELSALFTFSKKNIKRGIIRRIKCESFNVVSTTVRLNASQSSTKIKSKAISMTKRKLIAPKRATKRSDDNVLTIQEMKPLQASIGIRRASKLAIPECPQDEVIAPPADPDCSSINKKPVNNIQRNKTSIKRKDHGVVDALQSLIPEQGKCKRKEKDFEITAKKQEAAPTVCSVPTPVVKEKKEKKEEKKEEKREVKKEEKKEEKKAVKKDEKKEKEKKKEVKKDEKKVEETKKEVKKEEKIDVKKEEKKELKKEDRVKKDKMEVVLPSLHKPVSNGTVKKQSPNGIANDISKPNKDVKVKEEPRPLVEKTSMSRRSSKKVVLEKDVVPYTMNDEFSFDVLKAKLKDRLQNDIKDNSEANADKQKIISLPTTLSVRDRTRKFEKIEKS